MAKKVVRLQLTDPTDESGLERGFRLLHIFHLKCAQFHTVPRTLSLSLSLNASHCINMFRFNFAYTTFSPHLIIHTFEMRNIFISIYRSSWLGVVALVLVVVRRLYMRSLDWRNYRWCISAWCLPAGRLGRIIGSRCGWLSYCNTRFGNMTHHWNWWGRRRFM